MNKELKDKINNILRDYSIDLDILASKSRKSKNCMFRFILMDILYQKEEYLKNKKLNRVFTLEKIGELFNRDHSTVIFAINKSRDFRVIEPNWNNLYNKIKEELDG